MRVPWIGERFICVDCEINSLAFNKIHTKKHTLVRVIQKVEEQGISTEERLKAVESQLESVQGNLSKIMQLLSKLFEKGTDGSPSDPLTKGDILDAAMAEPSPVVPSSVKGEDRRTGENWEGRDDNEAELEDVDVGDQDEDGEDENEYDDENDYEDENEYEDEDEDAVEGKGEDEESD